MQNKLKAFTIFEMVVAMVITAILVSLIYTAYVIVSKSFLNFQKKHDEMAVVLQLDQVMKRDFRNSAKIFQTDGSVVLKKDTASISYTFLHDMVLRKGAVIDTFKVVTGEISASFEGTPSIFQYGNDRELLLDRLNMEIILDKEKIPYHYDKIYSSADLFKPDTDAIH